MTFKLKILDKNKIHVKDLVVSSNQILLDAIVKSKVQINHVCGGNASCGTCLIHLIDGKLTSQTKLEQEMHVDRGFKLTERLSCQCKPKSDLTVMIP